MNQEELEQHAIDQIIDNSIDEDGDPLIELLDSGEIPVEEFGRKVRGLLSNLYIQLALLALAGDILSRLMVASIRESLQNQYDHLDRMLVLIAAGLSIAETRRRLRMYFNSARSAYWGVRDIQAAQAGYTEEHWYAVGDRDTCSPCNDADHMGWQPLGTFGTPGSGIVLNGNPPTQCLGLTNCRCRKRYR